MMFSELADGERELYVSQSVFSGPNELAGHYADLPADPAALAGIVRNLLFHRMEEEIFGYRIPERWRHEDAETRYVDDIPRIVLARDGRPLDRARELSARFVGICSDFSLLYCSMLRHVGIPARVRNGFANYFGSDGFNFDPDTFGLPPEEGGLVGDWFVAGNVRTPGTVLTRPLYRPEREVTPR
ncbi:hypothetical protein GCM10023321_36980 [Pseudonocardia eucalypti]|uniref:Transglutaminase-like domain-containing protein n=1 Tax=Pseudonocardia eucalypti TaxID=648755 RepID=A0ABP9Q7K2_9PSEU|nr:hypothetical protein [Pseudonocardia eucalypti]